MSLSSGSKQSSVCYLFQPSFLIGVFSEPEIEAILSSEESVDFQRTIRRYIPENRALHTQYCENLKSYKYLLKGYVILIFSKYEQFRSQKQA
jgi:hypothetical protein